MDAQAMLIAEMLALRCSIAALAREVLLRHGSEVFVHAQSQAEHFAQDAQSSAGAFPEDVRSRAVRIVSDIFTLADGV